MPVFPYVCPDGHEFELVRSMKEPGLGIATCVSCGEIARQDYSKKKPLPPVIDGPSPGYYAADTGWPKDPSNPAKRICPGKRAVYDYNIKKQDQVIPGKGGFME